MHENVVKLPIVNIYRIKTDKGEVLFPRHEFAYLRDGAAYDHKKVHYHNRFRCEVNTSAFNILMTDIVAYDRERNEFTENADDVFMYVGHVTLEEWQALAAKRCAGESWYVIEMALDIIKEKTGIDRLKQFQTQDYGPDYWDDPADEPA